LCSFYIKYVCTMKSTILTLFTVTGLLLTACTRKTVSHEDYPTTYTIAYEDGETFDWYSHIEVEEVVPFEFSDSSMISLIQGCQVTDDRIIVHDYKQHLLFVFDRKGNYLYSIHNPGNGPGEYLDIRSFCTSADGKDIIINDGYKLLFYNLADGTFQQTRPLNLEVDNPPRNVMFSSCINPSDSTFFLWTDMGDHTLYKYDGKEMTGLKPRKNYQLGGKKFFMNYEGKYLVCPDYGEFGVTTINGEKRFFIDFGDKTIPEEILPKSGADIRKLEKEPYFKTLFTVLEGQTGIYISALSPKTTYYDIYIDKVSGKILKGSTDPKARLNILQVEGDAFYALFYPEYVEDDSPLKQTLVTSTKFTDNPLLIKFKMKPIK